MYKNINHLKIELQDIFTFHDPHITIHKPERIPETIDKLVSTAVFANDETLKAKACRIIHHLAAEKGVYSKSIRPLYKSIGEGKIGGFTVPAINIRMFTYDVARTIFRVAKQKKVGAFIIEIARSESEYTEQPPSEFATTILAAAIKEDYKWPVFIQGDHCQFNTKLYMQDKIAELKRVEDWVLSLLEAGFRNIDIDGSTLVDLSKPSLHAQQKDNAFVTAAMTKFIREKQPVDSNIAIGGEIGHIGEKNSTVEDFEAFMTQYINHVARNSGISKVSVQTGTSHGGIVNSDGTVQKMAVDFSVLKNVGKVARGKYKLAGPVQHGASTLSVELLQTFVESKTAEIHLSTGFQNLVFDTMPKRLRDEMYGWLKKNCKEEWDEKWTEEQFLYKTRKKSWGPFKKQVWGLTDEEKKPIIQALEKYLGTLFTKLNVVNTAKIVQQYANK
jgi:fructose/tagatose bisphosphate aldolase